MVKVTFPYILFTESFYDVFKYLEMERLQCFWCEHFQML